MSYYALGGILRIVQGLSWWLLWFFALWIYFDGKRWRRKGVAVYPGLVAGVFLIAYIATIIWYYFYYGWGYGYYSILTDVVGYLPIIFIIGYMVLRKVRYAQIAKEENPPLPPAPAWQRWFFLIIFFIPVLLVVVLLIFFAVIFRSGFHLF